MREGHLNAPKHVADVSSWRGGRLWGKRRAKQVTSCQRVGINKAARVLIMACFSESCADGCLPMWCVSHVVWSPHINYPRVSPRRACFPPYPDSRAEVFMQQGTQWHPPPPAWDSSLLACCGGLVGGRGQMMTRLINRDHFREAFPLQIGLR